jgi:ion channel-forming bestrophin family protein
MKLPNLTLLVVSVSAPVSPIWGFVHPSFVNHNPSTTSTTSTTKASSKLSIIPSRHRLRELEWKTPEDWQVTEWLRKYGEVSRYYRRDVFTANDWVRSRRPTRFWETICNTHKSGLFRQISLELAVLSYGSFLLVLYNKVNWAALIGRNLPQLKLPLVPFNLVAAFLGLLLTFRTNVCYQRWNEARTAWGKVINDSRSLARMASIWSATYKPHPQLIQRFADAICSFSRSLMNRTLPSQEDETNFQLYCFKQLNSPHNDNYGTRLFAAQHRPTAALAELTSILTLFNFHPLHQIEIEKQITELCSAMGACERIFTSPTPTFYPRHTIRFLAFWLYLLPLALFEPLGGGFLLVPVMTMMGGFLLGIEELSNQMEEPFSILPMEKMCENSIRKPIQEQVQRSLQAIPTVPNNNEQQPNNPTTPQVPYNIDTKDYYFPKKQHNPHSAPPTTMATSVPITTANGTKQPKGFDGTTVFHI